MRARRAGWLGTMVGASSLLIASCGGGAAEPVVDETAGAEDPTPRSAFTGTWNGARFDARWAALGWQWPGGWTVFLSDRPPNEGDVGLPVDATYVELRFGDPRHPAATDPGTPSRRTSPSPPTPMARPRRTRARPRPRPR